MCIFVNMKQYRKTQYYIDEQGKIYNSTTKRYLKHCVRKFSKSNSERVYVGLWIDGKQRSTFLHRMLAEVFIPNPKNLPYINHIDGNPLNNSLNNLEWCSASENNIHAIRTGLRPTKLNEYKVKEIREKLAQGMTYDKLAKEYNVGRTIIYKIAHNISWSI